MPSPLARLPDFMRLTRLDRPIGTWLLMWPTLAALWLAGDGLPTRHNLIIFIAGVYVMRAAGCVINDYADRNFDAHVKRTHDRPLATGRISAREALILFFALLAIAFVLVCFTNAFTIMLSFGAAALAASYPFMKRYTHLPQVVLGAAFGWSIPMAFGAEQGHVPAVAWWLFFANIVWTLVYDTWYAMVDRDDDLKIGIKSTAVLFGRMDLVIQGALQVLMLMLLAVVGSLAGLDGFYWAALVAIAAVFVHQQRLCRTRTREGCFQAFLNNHWVGVLLFAGIALATWQA
ncbi:4-hydroxybenzoate octaprenyltransferase [Kushneria phyllosphaerae]|uniref:4-hydroxybenzoate octaprenyltransferase n=1 Tax=Kushneria phyllosphaerae TaxID=2100822 RepID=A0A2R8CHQ1_9GAMM|nr:4-hydroxybenzoate octaprenyltransferase [Kushneria phyllosphaerae]SPJ32342.1 4-hydroxybenzoate octaprenyltransferase [Kushneria phyllosphaerae]